jgi:hypothetical protein
MVELEFWDERRGVTVARVTARDLETTPVAGDVVYIPDKEESGVYRHLKILSRHFYYGQEGALVTIRLHSEVL